MHFVLAGMLAKQCSQLHHGNQATQPAVVEAQTLHLIHRGCQLTMLPVACMQAPCHPAGAMLEPSHRFKCCCLSSRHCQALYLHLGETLAQCPLYHNCTLV